MAVDHSLRLQLREVTRNECSDWLRVAVVVDCVIFIAPGAAGNERRGKGVKIFRLSKICSTTPIHTTYML